MRASDLVARLATRSQNLPTDKLAKARGQTRFVELLARRLDATGDANDLPGTQRNYIKLVKVMATMKAYYTLPV